MATTKAIYGRTADGREVEQFTLGNQNGMEVRCIGYGCRITHILLPAENSTVDVVLGYDDLAGYEQDQSGQGAFVGRFLNRIRNAEFTLNGKTYHLPKGEGNSFLHGSFAKQVFKGETVDGNGVRFTYVSPDGEDGFPGELRVSVTYTLTDKNELLLDMQATSSADTYVNFTNHAYFNLAGEDTGYMGGQLLLLNASSCLELDKELLPTGRIFDVAGGAFDFSKEKPIGRDMQADDPQIKIGGGYDICFILDKLQPGTLVTAAIAKDPASGRSLEVFTTQPAIHLYTSNMLDEAAPGKGGRKLGKWDAFCLETEHYADSPHHPDFPSTLLRAGESFHEVTIFKFGW